MAAVRAGAAAALLPRTRARFLAASARRRGGGGVAVGAGVSQMRLAREPALSPASAHFAVAAASPLLQALDELGARARDTGLVERWSSQTRHEFVLAGITTDDDSDTLDHRPAIRKALKLEQVMPAFQGLAAGLALATVAFLAEKASTSSWRPAHLLLFLRRVRWPLRRRWDEFKRRQRIQ